MQTKIYKCKYCGAILCLPAKTWEKYINCHTCNKNMIVLDDDFDLSEIVDCETTNAGVKNEQ